MLAPGYPAVSDGSAFPAITLRIGCTAGSLSLRLTSQQTRFVILGLQRSFRSKHPCTSYPLRLNPVYGVENGLLLDPDVQPLLLA